LIRVALKGLLGRKFRAATVAFAIVLGVAMVSGTFVLTDTISHAFDRIFVSARSGTSVVVSGKTVVQRSIGSNATVPVTLLAPIRRLPGVKAAAGAIKDQAKIIGKNGKAITTRGSPTFGYGVDFSHPRFNPLTLLTGRWPAAGEVAVDKTTAEKQGFRLGQMIGVEGRGPVGRYRLTGTVGIGGVSTGGTTFAAFDLVSAQRIFAKEGAYDSISVAAKSGTAEAQLVREIRPLLPASAQVKTAAQQAQSDSQQIQQGLSFLTYFLLAFAGIALFVGSFVIFNTLSITVAQRTREFATLRTLGALRRQVLQSVVIEMLVLGLLSSVAGLALGLGLAKALSALLSGAGLSLPQTGIVFATRTVVVSLLVGVVVALLAGIFPALRATRVPPIAAVREGATLPKSRLAQHASPIAGVVIAVAVAILGVGMFVGGLSTVTRLIALAAGCLALFIGVALVSPPLVGPLAAVVGRPSARLGGVAGRLARENAARNPGRTATTAASLMIGLALVTFVAVLGQGLHASISDTLNRDLVADYVVSPVSSRQTTFAPAAGNAVASAPEVAVASNVRGEQAKVAGGQATVTGLDPATITKGYRFEWKHGSDAALRQLGRNGVIVTDTFATGKSLRLGSRVRVVTPDDKTHEFVVKGIYKAPALGSVLGSVSLSRDVFDATFARPQNQDTFITVRGTPTQATQRSLEGKLAAYPDTKLQTRKQFITSQESSVSTLLSLLYVLLALSVIVSLFGMVNALALSVLERTRELGMLRAVGMTRREVRRLVRYESVITASIGAVLGLPLGIFLAALVTRALSSQGIVFALPGTSLVVFAVLAVVAGVAAAILPARRAAGLNVLEALQYE
jgi:putative ABC transport system permease protein